VSAMNVPPSLDAPEQAARPTLECSVSGHTYTASYPYGGPAALTSLLSYANAGNLQEIRHQALRKVFDPDQVGQLERRIVNTDDPLTDVELHQMLHGLALDFARLPTPTIWVRVPLWWIHRERDQAYLTIDGRSMGPVSGAAADPPGERAEIERQVRADVAKQARQAAEQMRLDENMRSDAATLDWFAEMITAGMPR
jgi:hypothetical protein